MQNSRNAREAELPAELPQVPLMLPNRRHGHQSSPSCLQKIDRASPEQPRHSANGRMAAATAPESWRLARHAHHCGLADLSMRQRRGAQIRRPFAHSIPTLWAGPRNTPNSSANPRSCICHGYRQQSCNSPQVHTTPPAGHYGGQHVIALHPTSVSL